MGALSAVIWGAFSAEHATVLRERLRGEIRVTREVFCAGHEAFRSPRIVRRRGNWGPVCRLGTVLAGGSETERWSLSVTTWGLRPGSPAAQVILRADVLDLRAQPVVMLRVLGGLWSCM